MATFEQDARAYANYEAKFDTPIRKMLANGNPLEAIRKIAGAYRVARNFPRAFDEEVGIPRYEPVVKALAKYLPDNTDSIDAVLSLTRDLRQIYRRDVLSASSKFLWFAWGRDIIIYDSQALASLRTHFPNLRATVNDYPAYCDAWRTRFSECSDEIANECVKQKVSAERWFHERVFDWHLWRSGK